MSLLLEPSPMSRLVTLSNLNTLNLKDFLLCIVEYYHSQVIYPSAFYPPPLLSHVSINVINILSFTNIKDEQKLWKQLGVSRSRNDHDFTTFVSKEEVIIEAAKMENWRPVNISQWNKHQPTNQQSQKTSLYEALWDWSNGKRKRNQKWRRLGAGGLYGHLPSPYEVLWDWSIFRFSLRSTEMRVFGPFAAVSLLVVYVYLLATRLLPLQSSQTDVHLHPANLTLINLDQFQFLVNQDQCANSPISLLVLVHSAPGNWRARQAIRNSWGR